METSRNVKALEQIYQKSFRKSKKQFLEIMIDSEV